MRAIDWISSWASSIIVAVMIGTIIEMILPEGSSKKYIKVVIGIYVVFTIVTPVITKLTGENVEVSDILNLDQYIEEAEQNSKTQNAIQEDNQDNIRNIYLSSMKEDMKTKLEGRGYLVTDIVIEIADDESYTINTIRLSVEKKEDTESNSSDETAEVEQNEKAGEKVEPIQEVEKVEISIAEGTEPENTNRKYSGRSARADREKEQFIKY